MSCQIIAFPTARTRTANRAAAVATKVRDNVVSLDAWREKVSVRRTLNGVFFSTDTLVTTGGVA